MFKYAVLIDKMIDENVFEESVVRIFDTQEEAEKLAGEVALIMEVDDPSKYEVVVAKIDEDSLEIPGEWDSYTESEALSVHEVVAD